MRFLTGIRRKSATFAALMVVVAAMSSGCIGAKVAVQAVARGIPIAAPFFEEALGLGVDALVGEALALGGGTKKGDQPGLYGGSRNKKSCARKKLIRFLKDPSNRHKALEWAAVQGIGVDETEDFIKRLTPVVLRNDTLVKNYDYRKGKAVGFDALLEAGIAVLVDRYGKPVVKCSCGNPLGVFEHDAGSADVTFQGKNKKWTAYDHKKVVKIEPVVEVTTYELVDVEEEDAGLQRRAGTDGAQDKPLPDDPGIADPPADEQVSPSATVTVTVAPDPTETELPPGDLPGSSPTDEPSAAVDDSLILQPETGSATAEPGTGA